MLHSNEITLSYNEQEIHPLPTWLAIVNTIELMSVHVIIICSYSVSFISKVNINEHIIIESHTVLNQERESPYKGTYTKLQWCRRGLLLRSTAGKSKRFLSETSNKTRQLLDNAYLHGRKVLQSITEFFRYVLCTRRVYSYDLQFRSVHFTWISALSALGSGSWTTPSSSSIPGAMYNIHKYLHMKESIMRE